MEPEEFDLDEIIAKHPGKNLEEIAKLYDAHANEADGAEFDDPGRGHWERAEEARFIATELRKRAIVDGYLCSCPYCGFGDILPYSGPLESLSPEDRAGADMSSHQCPRCKKWATDTEWLR